MKTSALLDYIRKDMLDDATEMVSGVSDQLISDAAIVRQLAEAERIYCRRAWVLEDKTTSACCTIALDENVTDYTLHRSVLFVKAARLSDTDIDLTRVGYNGNRVFSSSYLTDPDFFDVNQAYTENAGRPDRYSLDMGTRVIRIRRKPDATAALLTVNLTVVRMPITEISLDDLDHEPEIPAEFHMDLALYAAAKVYNRPNIDADLRSMARQWEAQFDAKVMEAKRDRQRFQQSEPQTRFGGWANDGNYR